MTLSAFSWHAALISTGESVEKRRADVCVAHIKASELRLKRKR